MKTNIDSNEVKRILEMHSKFKKKPLLEQETPQPSKKEIDYKLLKDSETAKCLKNGIIRPLKDGSSYAYVAKTKSGLDVIFYPNMTYKFFESGKTGKWKCTKAEQLKGQRDANTEDIIRIKKEGNWLEASETKTTKENLENPKMYEKKVVNGVTLYRPVISSGVASGLTDEQIKVIKKYTDLGGKLRKDLDAEEAQTWTSKVVYPAGSLFSQDLVMYFPPSNVTGAEGVNVEDMFNKAVSNQTPTSKGDCRDTIRAYYNAWQTKKQIEPNTFLPMKEKVQACVNQFDGKWGGVLSKIDDYVTILRGGQVGNVKGPLTYGGDSKWRIN